MSPKPVSKILVVPLLVGNRLQPSTSTQQLAESVSLWGTRLELTEKADSTLREQLEWERERADRLEEELQQELSKGFWQRLFGG
jgi:chaperonin cofactor prefoldin